MNIKEDAAHATHNVVHDMYHPVSRNKDKEPYISHP